MADRTKLKLTSKEVANIFGVNIRTIGRWSDEGKLRHFRTPGGHRRYYAAEIEKLVEIQSKEPNE